MLLLSAKKLTTTAFSTCFKVKDTKIFQVLWQLKGSALFPLLSKLILQRKSREWVRKLWNCKKGFYGCKVASITEIENFQCHRYKIFVYFADLFHHRVFLCVIKIEVEEEVAGATSHASGGSFLPTDDHQKVTNFLFRGGNFLLFCIWDWLFWRKHCDQVCRCISSVSKSK